MANNSRLDSMPFNSINDLMFDHWETHPNYPVERGRPSPLPELNRPLGYGPYEDMDEHERTPDDLMIQRRDPNYSLRHRNGGRLNFRDGGSPGRGNPDDRTRDRGRRFMPHEMQQHFPAHPQEYNLNNPTPRHWHRKPWQFYNKAADGGAIGAQPWSAYHRTSRYADGRPVFFNSQYQPVAKYWYDKEGNRKPLHEALADFWSQPFPLSGVYESTANTLWPLVRDTNPAFRAVERALPLPSLGDITLELRNKGGRTETHSGYANGGRQNLSPQLPFWDDPQGYADGGDVEGSPFQESNNAWAPLVQGQSQFDDGQLQDVAGRIPVFSTLMGVKRGGVKEFNIRQASPERPVVPVDKLKTILDSDLPYLQKHNVFPQAKLEELNGLANSGEAGKLQYEIRGGQLEALKKTLKDEGYIVNDASRGSYYMNTPEGHRIRISTHHNPDDLIPQGRPLAYRPTTSRPEGLLENHYNVVLHGDKSLSEILNDVRAVRSSWGRQQGLPSAYPGDPSKADAIRASLDKLRKQKPPFAYGGRIGYAPGGPVQRNPFGEWSDVDLAGMTPARWAELMARMNKLNAVRPDLSGKVVPPIYEPRVPQIDPYANSTGRSAEVSRFPNMANTDPRLKSGMLPAIPGVTTPMPPSLASAHPYQRPSNVSQFTPPYRNPNVEDLERMRVQQGFKSPAEIRQLPRRVPITAAPEIGQKIDLRKPTPPNAEILPPNVGTNPEARMNWWDNMRENRNEPPMSIGPGDVIDWPKRQYGGRIGYADGGMSPNPFEFGPAQGLLDAEREAQLGIAPVTEDQVRENAARRQQYFQTVGRAPEPQWPMSAPPEAPQQPAPMAANPFDPVQPAKVRENANLLNQYYQNKSPQAAPESDPNFAANAKARYEAEANMPFQDKMDRYKGQVRQSINNPTVFKQTADETSDWLRAVGKNIGQVPAASWGKYISSVASPGITLFDMFMDAKNRSPAIQAVREHPELLAELQELHKRGGSLENYHPQHVEHFLNTLADVLTNPAKAGKSGVGSSAFAQDLVRGIYDSATANPYLFGFTLPGKMENVISTASSIGDKINLGTPIYKPLETAGDVAGATGLFKFVRAPLRGSLNIPNTVREAPQYLGQKIKKSLYEFAPGIFGQDRQILGGAHTRELLPWRSNAPVGGETQFNLHTALNRNDPSIPYEGPRLRELAREQQPFTNSASSVALGPLSVPVNAMRDPVRFTLESIKYPGAGEAGSTMRQTTPLIPKGAYIDIVPKGAGGEALQINPVGLPANFFKNEKNLQNLMSAISSDARFQGAQTFWPFEIKGKNFIYRHPGGQIHTPENLGVENFERGRKDFESRYLPTWNDVKQESKEGYARFPMLGLERWNSRLRTEVPGGRNLRGYGPAHYENLSRGAGVPAPSSVEPPVAPPPQSLLRTQPPAPEQLPAAANVYPQTKQPTMLDIDRMAKEAGISRQEMARIMESRGLFTSPKADGGRIDRRPSWYRPSPRPQQRPSDSMKIQDTIGPDVPIYNNNMAPPPPPRMDYKSIYPEIMQPRSANGGRVQRYAHKVFWDEDVA